MRKLYLTCMESGWGYGMESRTPKRLRDKDCSSSSQHDGNPLPGENVFAAGRNDDVAVGASASSDIARTQPGHKFHLRIFVFSGKNGGKKTLETSFDADVRFELSMGEGQGNGRSPGERFKHRAGEEFKRDHGR